jgi:uncharacterized protein
MTLAEFTRTHPYRSSLLFLLIVLLVITAFGIIHAIVALESLVQIAAADLTISLVGIFLIERLGWWGEAGYTTGIRLGHIPLFVLPCAIGLLSLSQGIVVTQPIVILSFAALTILIGFTEETFFRGLIFTTLLPVGTIRAAAISSFLFAAPHLLNVIGGTWDPVFTVVDTFAAFGIGITFAALRLRTGSIWPLIGIHALFDFTALLSAGGIEVPAQSETVLLSSIVIGFVFVVYGLFILRNELRKKENVNELIR